MESQPGVEPIVTARLELVTLTPRFVQALVAGDPLAAGHEIGARVGTWLASDPSHVVQLSLAWPGAQVVGFHRSGRAIVLRGGPLGRLVIGSVGFHGPPDDRGRLEVGCRIHPTHRGRGYAAEALTAMLDWATARLGITRFVVAVPSPRDPGDVVPVEIAIRPAGSIDEWLDDLGRPARDRTSAVVGRRGALERQRVCDDPWHGRPPR